MSGSMSGMWKRSYGEGTWAPQPKGAATDNPNLWPPRHISTLPELGPTGERLGSAQPGQATRLKADRSKSYKLTVVARPAVPL
jgi:hypothetical protein